MPHATSRGNPSQCPREWKVGLRRLNATEDRYDEQEFSRTARTVSVAGRLTGSLLRPQQYRPL